MWCGIARVILLSNWVHLFGKRLVRPDNPAVVPRAARFGPRDGFKGRLHRAAVEREILRRQMLG